MHSVSKFHTREQTGLPTARVYFDPENEQDEIEWPLLVVFATE